MGRRLTVPVLLAGAAASAYALGDAILAPRPSPASPGFVDTLLASRVVVAALRVAIIAASCFVVASVVALTRKGRWLTRVGPVQVSDVSKIYEEDDQLKGSLEIAERAMENLERQVAESNRLLKQEKRGAGEPR